MIKPKLLDLYCKGGGAGYGYDQAGFSVTGIDIEDQPNYMDGKGQFIQDDAMAYLIDHWREYDVIHASPPCQAYSQLTKSAGTEDNYPKWIKSVHDCLVATGKPYVIENVRGAALDLEAPIILCGYSFGLKVYRHRYFEVNPFIISPPHIDHPEACPSSGRGASPKYGIISVTGNGGAPNLGMPYLDYARLAMGIHWMNRAEISQSIPPAFTHYIGKQLMRVLS